MNVPVATELDDSASFRDSGRMKCGSYANFSGRSYPGVKTWPLGLVALSLGACGVDHDEAAFASVGNTGCDAEGLVAFDFNEERQTWHAACRDKYFACSQIVRDITCTVIESPPEPEVQLRVNHLLKLQPAQRVVFTASKLADVPWERFSRQVQVAAMLTKDQREDIQSIEQIYLDLPTDLDARLRKCSRGGWYGFETTGKDFYYRPMDDCAEAGILRDARVEPLAKGPAQKGFMLAGVGNIKPLNKPSLPVPPARDSSTKLPRTAEVSEETLSLENSVRAWLGNSAVGIIECAGSPRVAVVVEVSDAGVAGIQLRGALSRTAEERCVATLLGEKTFSSGPARVVHLVESPATAPEAP
jgi:hypothetical protein